LQWGHGCFRAGCGGLITIVARKADAVLQKTGDAENATT
jgi:hypothetical protein